MFLLEVIYFFDVKENLSVDAEGKIKSYHVNPMYAVCKYILDVLQ